MKQRVIIFLGLVFGMSGPVFAQSASTVYVKASGVKNVLVGSGTNANLNIYIEASAHATNQVLDGSVGGQRVPFQSHPCYSAGDGSMQFRLPTSDPSFSAILANVLVSYTYGSKIDFHGESIPNVKGLCYLKLVDLNKRS